MSTAGTCFCGADTDPGEDFCDAHYPQKSDDPICRHGKLRCGECRDQIGVLVIFGTAWVRCARKWTLRPDQIESLFKHCVERAKEPRG